MSFVGKNMKKHIDNLIAICFAICFIIITILSNEIKLLEDEIQDIQNYTVDVSLYNNCEGYRASAEYGLALCQEHVDKGRQLMDLYKRVCNPKKKRVRK